MGQSILKYINQDHAEEQREREGFIPNPEYQIQGYDKNVLGWVKHVIDGADCFEWIICAESLKEA